MSIISLSFLVFTAGIFLGYFLLPKKLRPVFLLMGSLFFYSCFGLKAFVYLGATILCSFIPALLMEKASPKKKKFLLTLSIVINLGLLILVKYLNFSLGIIYGILGKESPTLQILVPLGIAFYTMQAISYCVDVYREKYAAEKNFFSYLLYMCYFPIILQGPISRYDQLGPQLREPQKVDFAQFKAGLSLMLYGFFKKMVLADRAAIVVDQVFGDYASYGGLQILIAALLYAIQIYADFSGCVDICRGLSQSLGIELAENFKHPYLATCVQDFWRRWHCSLSSWFRDYLYIPLGGSRKGTGRKYLNLFLVFLASGLWHGVGFQFIVWGMLHALYQIIGGLTKKPRYSLYERLGVRTECFSFRLLQQLFTFGLVSFAWVFFRAPSTEAAVSMLLSIRRVDLNVLSTGGLTALGLTMVEWLILGLSVAVLFTVSVLQQKGSVRRSIERQMTWFRYAIYILAILTIAILGVYGPGFDASQFIYMQF